MIKYFDTEDNPITSANDIQIDFDYGNLYYSRPAPDELYVIAIIPTEDPNYDIAIAHLIMDEDMAAHYQAADAIAIEFNCDYKAVIEEHTCLFVVEMYQNDEIDFEKHISATEKNAKDIIAKEMGFEEKTLTQEM